MARLFPLGNILDGAIRSLGNAQRLGYACLGVWVADRALVSPTFRKYAKLANPMHLGDRRRLKHTKTRRALSSKWRVTKTSEEEPCDTGSESER